MGRIWDKIKKAWLDAWEEAGRDLGMDADIDADQIADELEHARRNRPRIHDNRTLLEKIDEEPAHQWTEAELSRWIDRLPDETRHIVLAGAKKRRHLGGDAILQFLCDCRRQWEQIQREQAAAEQAAAKANRPTIGGLLWAWDEAMLMSDEREFFARENKKARQRGE